MSDHPSHLLPASLGEEVRERQAVVANSALPPQYYYPHPRRHPPGVPPTQNAMIMLSAAEHEGRRRGPDTLRAALPERPGSELQGLDPMRMRTNPPVVLFEGGVSLAMYPHAERRRILGGMAEDRMRDGVGSDVPPSEGYLRTSQRGGHHAEEDAEEGASLQRQERMRSRSRGSFHGRGTSENPSRPVGERETVGVVQEARPSGERGSEVYWFHRKKGESDEDLLWGREQHQPQREGFEDRGRMAYSYSNPARSLSRDRDGGEGSRPMSAICHGGADERTRHLFPPHPHHPLQQSYPPVAPPRTFEKGDVRHAHGQHQQQEQEPHRRAMVPAMMRGRESAHPHQQGAGEGGGRGDFSTVALLPASLYPPRTAPPLVFAPRGEDQQGKQARPGGAGAGDCHPAFQSRQEERFLVQQKAYRDLPGSSPQHGSNPMQVSRERAAGHEQPSGMKAREGRDVSLPLLETPRVFPGSSPGHTADVTPQVITPSTGGVGSYQYRRSGDAGTTTSASSSGRRDDPSFPLPPPPPLRPPSIPRHHRPPFHPLPGCPPGSSQSAESQAVPRNRDPHHHDPSGRVRTEKDAEEQKRKSKGEQKEDENEEKDGQHAGETRGGERSSSSSSYDLPLRVAKASSSPPPSRAMLGKPSAVHTLSRDFQNAQPATTASGQAREENAMPHPSSSSSVVGKFSSPPPKSKPRDFQDSKLVMVQVEREKNSRTMREPIRDVSPPPFPSSPSVFSRPTRDLSEGTLSSAPREVSPPHSRSCADCVDMCLSSDPSRYQRLGRASFYPPPPRLASLPQPSSSALKRDQWSPSSSPSCRITPLRSLKPQQRQLCLVFMVLRPVLDPPMRQSASQHRLHYSIADVSASALLAVPLDFMKRHQQRGGGSDQLQEGGEQEEEEEDRLALELSEGRGGEEEGDDALLKEGGRQQSYTKADEEEQERKILTLKALLQPGDICRLTGGFTAWSFKGEMIVTLEKSGFPSKSSRGQGGGGGGAGGGGGGRGRREDFGGGSLEVLGRFSFPFVTEPDMSCMYTAVAGESERGWARGKGQVASEFQKFALNEKEEEDLGRQLSLLVSSYISNGTSSCSWKNDVLYQTAQGGTLSSSPWSSSLLLPAYHTLDALGPPPPHLVLLSP